MSNLNAYPAPQTPLSGTEAIVGAQTQSGVVKTVTITLAQVATFVVADINRYSQPLTPAPDGVTLIFTTPSNFVTGSTRPNINGLRQFLGIQYTETGPNQITYISGYQPHTGNHHAIDYDAA